MPDAIVVQRFKALVLPHMNSAFNVARWLTHNDQDAQDVVQEAYLRAFRFLGELRSEDARAWLLAIVRNTFYTWHRQNREHGGDVLEFEEEVHSQEASVTERDESPEAIFARGQNLQRVHRALRRLKLEYREVIILRELEELSYKEISSILDIPIGTVMSRLARGRQQLAEILAPTDREV